MEPSMTNNETPTRRSFLSWLWGLLGLAVFAETLWLGVSFLKPRSQRRKEKQENTLVVAGPVEQFSPGTVTAFQQGKFYLVRLTEGGFLALDRSCTHLGCTVPWDDERQRFVCPCHASSFSLTGEVLSPPAPRPLDRYPVRIENQIVKVDARKPIKRATFTSDQAVQA